MEKPANVNASENQQSDSPMNASHAASKEIQQFLDVAKEMNTKIHRAFGAVSGHYNRSTVPSMSEQEKAQVQENIIALDKVLGDIESTVNDFRWWLKNRVYD